MKIVTKTTVILEESDIKLLKMPLPVNPCINCRTNKASCCGCPEYYSYKKEIKQLEEHDLLETRAALDHVDDIFAEKEALQSKLLKIDKDLKVAIEGIPLEVRKSMDYTTAGGSDLHASQQAENKMAKIWLENNEVKSNMDLSIYNDAQMREIHSGLEENLDVTIYAKPEFISDQMAEIRQGLERKLDITIYAKPEYTRNQMVEIRLGLERKLDVTIYAKPEYTWDQMAEIRRGLVEKLDVSIYAKPEYDACQMKEIHHGLVENLDVTIYAKPEYTWDQMKEIRLGLTNALDNTPKKMKF